MRVQAIEPFPARSELSGNGNLYRQLFEASKDAMFVSTPDGKFIDVNAAAAELFGYSSKDELLAANITDDLYAFSEDRNRVKRELEKNGYVKDLEVTLKRRDGSHISVLETATVEYDEHGRARSYRGILRDITNQKQAEAQLKKYLRELEDAKHTAEEQARRLREQTVELVQAREAALEASRLKSEFVANMSHEIRTPLNGIIGMTGLLRDTECTPEQKEYIEIIHKSGEALLNIVNNILDFSKIEAGKMRLETVDFDLRNAVEETLEILAVQAYEKKIEIGSLIYSNVPIALRGDVGRLRQVLTNLVGNAIKFTEEGEVAVRVRTEHETATTATLKFSVTDTGVGISPADQQKLFQSFTQVDGSTTRKYEGTGLGLVISKQLVEMMGGAIGVESTPGKGSTFWFTVVFEKQNQVPSTDAKPLENLKGIKVLIVDDNKTNLDIIHYQVSAWGMRGETARSGQEALRLLHEAVEKEDPFELVLLDMHMPEMDGLELARRIRAQDALRSTRLLMLTSIGEQSSLTLREAGIELSLTKPVRQRELFQYITRIMSQRCDGPDLPLTESSECTTAHEAKKTAKLRRRRNYLRILIAEDNPNNQKVASFMIRKLGHRADVAGNGKEAVDALEYIPYDIVFMDCHMPEMDGFEATREIRRREGDSKHTLIIAMTANALEGDRERCLEAGMDDYISKPVKLDVIKDMLKKWIKLEDDNNSDGDLLSEERLRELCELSSDSDLVKEMIRIFLRDTPLKIQEVQDSIRDDDPKKLVESSHYLKGSCSNMGALAMATLCLKLETIGRSFSTEGALPLADSLKRKFQKTRELLIRYLNT